MQALSLSVGWSSASSRTTANITYTILSNPPQHTPDHGLRQWAITWTLILCVNIPVRLFGWPLRRSFDLWSKSPDKSVSKICWLWKVIKMTDLNKNLPIFNSNFLSYPIICLLLKKKWRGPFLKIIFAQPSMLSVFIVARVIVIGWVANS